MTVGDQSGEESVSIELFRRRADECRRLAAAVTYASDKAFWLGLVERWQALENQKAQQPVRDKPRSTLRRQPEQVRQFVSGIERIKPNGADGQSVGPAPMDPK